jgi:VWFA-related protein
MGRHFAPRARKSSAVSLAVAACLCLLGLVLPPTGQAQSGASQPQSRKKKSHPPAPADNPLAISPSQPLRSESRLVELSVVVDDRHGKPILGLTRDNFTILDDGKKQVIKVFLVHESEPRKRQLAALPPDTYSNRMADHSIPMSATVILLDGLNTRISDQQYARLQVIKFLQQIQPQDRVALYTLGDKLTVLHDFTNDAQSLLDALLQYRGRMSPEYSEAVSGRAGRDRNNGNGARPTGHDSRRDDMFAGFLHSFGEDDRAFQVRDRAARTMQALDQIGNHVALLPGRKNLVWVSGSFLPAANLQDVEMNTPDGGLLFTSDLESVSRRLNNASLVLYPVDAHGLLVGGMFGAFGEANYGQFAVMDEIAQRTGGEAFYNTNNILGAIRKAVDDSRVSYEIGYYPQIENWDGSFHKVRIKVDLRGAHVRAREGYFAVPGPTITPKLRQPFFNAAATNMLEADGIGITAHVLPQTRPGRNLGVSVTLEPGDLELAQRDARWSGDFDTMLVQLDQKGVVLGATDDPVQFRITAEQYRQMMRYGLSYKEKIDVRPRARELRIVVRDGESGKIGSVAVPLARYLPPSKPAR